MPYSTTGTWIVRSGDRLIGPFDGRTPAKAFVKELKEAGYPSTTHRLWSPGQIREAIAMRQQPDSGLAPEPIQPTTVTAPSWSQSDLEQEHRLNRLFFDQIGVVTVHVTESTTADELFGTTPKENN